MYGIATAALIAVGTQGVTTRAPRFRDDRGSRPLLVAIFEELGSVRTKARVVVIGAADIEEPSKRV
jgi:hypothetical protein